MVRNKDYRDGIKFLLIAGRETGINIRKYLWIADLSIILSKTNKCLMFWQAVYKQKKFDRLSKCRTLYDILYRYDTNLFIWSQSKQGHDFWRFYFCELFFDESKASAQMAEISKHISLNGLRFLMGQ